VVSLHGYIILCTRTHTHTHTQTFLATQIFTILVCAEILNVFHIYVLCFCSTTKSWLIACLCRPTAIVVRNICIICAVCGPFSWVVLGWLVQRRNVYLAQYACARLIELCSLETIKTDGFWWRLTGARMLATNLRRESSSSPTAVR
jgi:hypothetical protein